MESLQVAFWHLRSDHGKHNAQESSSPVGLLTLDSILQVNQAYRDLQQRLVDLGLQVNPKKTAFIATDKATDRELRALLKDNEPPVEPVMRDLGVDHQAARRRRIPVMKQRLTKASDRKIKLKVLKIPALKVRLRLRRGGIQPVALWGIEGQGLAPRYSTALRQARQSTSDITMEDCSTPPALH